MAHPALTLPNLLTASRLVFAPLVVWRLVVGDTHGAFWLFFAAACTDLFDGNLARLLNQKSVLGAWLDPIADKTMLLSTLLSLVWVGYLPMWLALVVLARDAVVLGGAAAYRVLTGHLEVAPTLSGKVATFMEFGLVSLILADIALALNMGAWLPPLVALVALMVVLSGVRYVMIWSDKTRRFLREQGRAA